MSHSQHNKNDISIKVTDYAYKKGSEPTIISTKDLVIAQWYWENEPDTPIIYQGLYWGKRSDYPDALLED